MATAPKPPRKHQPQGLRILHEDRDIVVVDKTAGLLTISDGRESARTAYAGLTDYVRKGNPKSPHRVFIVHRLDRDTSGVLVFARTEAAKCFLQDHWDQAEKTYLAIVQGIPPKDADTISTHLAENAAGRVYSTTNPGEGKLSHTRYRVLERRAGTCLLEVTLLTGRKNQIRVHLAGIGCPIVGDGKYGRGTCRARRLGLHALRLSIPHPYLGQRMTFEALPPDSFRQLLGPRTPPPS